jgi:hypothetical protein
MSRVGMSGIRWPGGGVRMARTVLAIAVGLGPSSWAQEVTLPAIHLGLGGIYRNGSWTVLTVRQPGFQQSQVRAWVEDADGQWVGSPLAPLRATADGVGEAQLRVRPGRPGGRLRIESLPDQPTDASPGTAAPVTAERIGGLAEVQAASDGVPSTTPLVLVVGNLPAATAAVRLVATDDRRSDVVFLQADDHRVTDGRDLDGFEAAIVCGSRIATLPTDTLAAIDSWVRRGGRLVFAAGDSALGIAADASLAAAWLPGSGPRPVQLKRFGAIEAYARAGGLASRVPPAGITVPRFESAEGVAGVVDAFDGTNATDLPLVVRRAHGFGTITWVGIDVDADWCREWPGCDRLVAALLGGREEQETATALADAGPRVPDLAGQLRVALDTYGSGATASKPVPFEIIALLGILYALALYPLDWWLVSRSGRPWVSWLSLPVLAGGFTAVAWGVGGLWGRDAPAEAQMADVLDVDAAEGLIRGSSWAAVRSPANDHLDVAVAPEPRLSLGEADAAVSWFADASAGFGGVDALVAHPSLAAGAYCYGESLAELRGVPIAAASSRLFEAGWTGQTEAAVADAALVRDARGLLTGTVSHALPFPLDDCWLLHAGWLYDVGRLAPGEIFDTEKGRGPRSLAAALTRRTARWDSDRAERWNLDDGNVGRILQVAGLHAAAGGRSYTGLEAGRLGRLDLSPLLLVDRAILVGRAPSATRGTAWRLRLGAGQGAGPETQPELGADLDVGAADGASLVRIVLPLSSATSLGEQTP